VTIVRVGIALVGVNTKQSVEYVSFIALAAKPAVHLDTGSILVTVVQIERALGNVFARNSVAFPPAVAQAGESASDIVA
jgi:hypothetical protein